MDSGDEATAFPPPATFLFTTDFCAARVFRLSDGGCNSRGTALTREDLRFPSCRNEVGPSTPTFFQGGDGGRGVERRELSGPASFRLFEGGPSVGSVATSFSLESDGVKSRFAESGGWSRAEVLNDLFSVSIVTRSSLWCDRPFKLPSCMSFYHGRQGPSSRLTPVFPTRTRSDAINLTSIDRYKLVEMPQKVWHSYRHDSVAGS